MKTYEQFLNEYERGMEPTHMLIKDLPQASVGILPPEYRGDKVLAQIERSRLMTNHRGNKIFTSDRFVTLYSKEDKNNDIGFYLKPSDVDKYFRELTPLEKTSMKYGI